MDSNILDMFSVLIIRNSRYMQKIFSEAVEGTGLNVSALVMLRILELNEGGVSASVLCDTACYDKALVSRQLADMLDKGYVMRNPEDSSMKRGYRYLLTDKGRSFGERFKQLTDELAKRITEDIDQNDLAAFYRIGAQLTDNVKKVADEHLI